MAWSWSHTHEAYSNAREQLGELSPITLITIRAEWSAVDDPCDTAGGFHAGRYRGTERALLKQYSRALTLKRAELFRESLEEQIWDLMSDGATCDNGGFNAWACPYGCGCHTVPFNPVTEGE